MSRFENKKDTKALARAIVSHTLDGNLSAAKLLLTTPYLKESNSSEVEKRILSWIDSFGDPLTLYREVYLTSPEELDTKSLGIFWTPERKFAHSPYGKLDNKPGHTPYVIEVQAPKSGVHDAETISTMKRYPGEREIRLKKGTSVKFVALYDAKGKKVPVRKPPVSVASLASTLTLRGDTEVALALLESITPARAVPEEDLPSILEERKARATEIFQIPTEDELREMYSKRKHHGRYPNPKEVESFVKVMMRRFHDPRTQQKAKKAVEEAKRNYHKEASLGKSYKNLLKKVIPQPSRDLTPFHDVYKDALSQEEIDAIATGQLFPYGWLGPFKPIEIVVSNEVPDPYLEDGNHRLKAALDHGASRIRAKIRFVEDGVLLQEVTAVIPLGLK